MTESEELAYINGQKALARRLMRTLVRELDDPEKTEQQWRIERSETVAALRELCEHFGDNDWRDNLHLADVVQKHLGNHLFTNP